MMIENRPCPRCNVPNTARITEGIAVCFNCRAAWRTEDPEGSVTPRAGAPVPPPEAPEAPAPSPAGAPRVAPRVTVARPYPFSARELARLSVYRDAVAAGFYNEGREDGPEEQAPRRAA